MIHEFVLKDVHQASSTWHSEKHVPELFAYDEVKRVARYELIPDEQGFRLPLAKPGYPEYLTTYEFESMRDFRAFQANPKREANIQDSLRVSEQTGAELLWRVQYRLLRTWQK